jgi:hypothetical protein
MLNEVICLQKLRIEEMRDFHCKFTIELRLALECYQGVGFRGLE